MKTYISSFILFILLIAASNSFAVSYEFSEIKTINKENVSIFPNPIQSKGTIKIISDKNCEAMIEFFDISGKRVKTLEKQNLIKGEQQISFQTDDLKNGIFFCKVRSENWLETIRIVIKH